MEPPHDRGHVTDGSVTQDIDASDDVIGLGWGLPPAQVLLGDLVESSFSAKTYRVFGKIESRDLAVGAHDRHELAASTARVQDVRSTLRGLVSNVAFDELVETPVPPKFILELEHVGILLLPHGSNR